MREDISANLQALEDLHREFDTKMLLIESGGDNLAANYSRELADFIIYVVSVDPSMFRPIFHIAYHLFPLLSHVPKYC